MDDYKQKLSDLLLTPARQNASDLHIGVGRRPTLRIDGVLIPLQKEPILTPEMSEGLVTALLTPPQKEQFLKDRQLDLSFSYEDKARFRVNVYFQRGPDRISLRAGQVHHLPARSALRHAHVPPRASHAAPSGPRRGDDRRDARPRVHLHRHDGGRDRPPGVLDPAHELGHPDDRPHHRLLPARAAGAGHIPTLGDLGGDRFRASHPAHRRRPRAGMRDHDRELGDPEPHPRAEGLSDRPRDRDKFAGRHDDPEPFPFEPGPRAGDLSRERGALLPEPVRIEDPSRKKLMKFAYTARTQAGELQTGSVEAGNRGAAPNILTGHQLFILPLESLERRRFADTL